MWGVVRTSSAALALGPEILAGALVVVNHGPGLFDGLNPRLSQGESTTRLLQNLSQMAHEFGAIPLIIHHSLLDTDHDLLFSRQQQILNSEIPSTAFISSAGQHFFLPTLELGVSPVPVPEHDYIGNRDERQEVVGFFGFFQYGGKDFDSLFHLVRELRGRLVGSVATSNSDELRRFEEALEDNDMPHDLGSGWIEDTELLDRLKEADYFYLPQHDYDHWNNSATARFVTNLDRPLFLPPHHPFLDMTDGSIFASTDDLPRIVSHFREPEHYAQAVARVRAFRTRARMANTATELCTNMVNRTAQVGQELLETASALSAERWLELSEAARPAFSAGLGLPDDAGLETAAAQLPTLYRSVSPRQYWRKHYELGDFAFPTALETVHAAYINCTKRHVSLGEIVRVLSRVMNERAEPLWDEAELVRAAVLQAIKDKGELFHDPEVVLLENGQLTDWQALIESDRIAGFLATKRQAQAAIRAVAADLPPAPPAITNMAELLVVPAEELHRRTAPLDLSVFDFEAVQAPRNLAQRMNRLIEQANAHGLRLGDCLVFDVPVPPLIEPGVRDYVVEDFLHYTSDLFVLNAIRRIDKRNPFPLETVVLSAMLDAQGRLAVLRHLMARSGNRVRIAGLESAGNCDAQAVAFERFINVARDPLFGLIEARNNYEVTRRHNTRWLLANKRDVDQLLIDSGEDVSLLNLLYAALVDSYEMHADDARRKADPVWAMTAEGRFFKAASTGDLGLPLVPERAVKLTAMLGPVLESVGTGLHAPEPIGTWTQGTEATLALALSPSTWPKGKMALKLELGSFGAAHFDGPRRLSLSLSRPPVAALSFAPDDRRSTGGPETLTVQTARIDSDAPVRYRLPLNGVTRDGVYTLRLAIDRVISPKAAGVSADERELGLLIKELVLGPA